MSAPARRCGRAALVRFLAQGVEDNVRREQIAADAGVSLRTFYRHFCVQARSAVRRLRRRRGMVPHGTGRTGPPSESIIESVHAAIMARPYDD